MQRFHGAKWENTKAASQLKFPSTASSRLSPCGDTREHEVQPSTSDYYSLSRTHDTHDDLWPPAVSPHGCKKLIGCSDENAITFPTEINLPFPWQLGRRPQLIGLLPPAPDDQSEYRLHLTLISSITPAELHIYTRQLLMQLLYRGQTQREKTKRSMATHDGWIALFEWKHTTLFLYSCFNAAAPQQSESGSCTRRHSTVTPVLNAAGEVISTETRGEQIVFLVIQFPCIVPFLSLQSSNCSSLYLSNCASGTQSLVASF